MRRPVVPLSLALLLPIAIASAPQQPSRSAAIVNRGLTAADFPKLQKLTDRVYVFSDLHSGGFGYLTNDLIVITDAGVLVADGQGTAAVTQKLVDEIRRLTPQPIVDVVVCSEHGDHTGGNVSFPSSAVFLSSPASQASLRTQAANDRPGGPKTIVPTETVSSTRVIRLGTTEIDVVYNGRAHTGGDLEVYLPAEKILFASEVFTNHIFPSMRTAYPSEWIATLEESRRLTRPRLCRGMASSRIRRRCGRNSWRSATLWGLSWPKRSAFTAWDSPFPTPPPRHAGASTARGPAENATRRSQSNVSMTSSTAS